MVAQFFETKLAKRTVVECHRLNNAGTIPHARVRISNQLRRLGLEISVRAQLIQFCCRRLFRKFRCIPWSGRKLLFYQ